MLGQRISKQVFTLDLDQSDEINRNNLDTLSALTTQWQDNQNFLILANKQRSDTERIDSLFTTAQPKTAKLLKAALQILKNPYNTEILETSTNTIRELESSILTSSDHIVSEYQNTTEKNLKELYRITYFIALIVA
jgi:outer membrane PBP1 activator LpoA protein